MTLAEDRQKPYAGEYIQLFCLDATIHGAGIHYFVKAADDASGVTWQGQYYTPVPIDVDGFEWNGQGTLPTPKIRVLNINGALTSLVQQYNDLVGATVTRTRTMRKYLDDGEDPNPDEHESLDIYLVERKSDMDDAYIEWELSSILDQQGVMLPGRQVLRDYCAEIYRYWNGTAFDYSQATCPYTGEACFDQEGKSASSSSDQCGKRLSDCKLRFGTNAVLPYGGFPGVARVR